MQTMTRGGRAIAAGALAALLGAVGAAQAQAATAEPAKAPYPNPAPIEQYRIASPADEIALARSAAPPSISGPAKVLTLGAHGYETAAKGTNGFVCIVERSWGSGFEDAEFWNPKERSPICFNAASARSVLPTYLQRTKWVLGGATKPQIEDRTRAALAAKRIPRPEIGSMCYMLSKDGYLSDSAPGGHWKPHLMFFVPKTELATWGAGLPGAPVMGDTGRLDPVTVFYVPVGAWSDGTPATPMKM